MICHGGAYVSTQILPKMIGIADFLLNLVTLTSYVKCLFVCVLLYNMPILNYLRRATLSDCTILWKLREGAEGGECPDPTPGSAHDPHQNACADKGSIRK